MKYLPLITLVALLTVSCQNPNEKKKETTTEQSSKSAPEMDKYPKLLQKVLEAHGGLETWNNYTHLKYIKIDQSGAPEQHITNLKNRKIIIDRDSVQIGFNGEQVWVFPDLKSFAGPTPRFYHNLHFYFFSIPFVLADPGAIYEDIGTSKINGKAYRALKITYISGVGDTPEDVYIAHFDPESYQLQYLLYTVTYYDATSEKFNALHYAEWQETGGLIVPKVYRGYVFNGKDSTLGDQRYVAQFDNVIFSEEPPQETIFEIPEGAEIDSLKN